MWEDHHASVSRVSEHDEQFEWRLASSDKGLLALPTTRASANLTTHLHSTPPHTTHSTQHHTTPAHAHMLCEHTSTRHITASASIKAGSRDRKTLL
jgi:hypothetical protein